ncbi:MAG: integrase [Rubrivivax sp.]|nr:MAG: integrase [Rubrivivax sp.]
MSMIVAFIPRSDLAAWENLAAFINSCRSQLTVFGVDFDFEGNVWDLTAYLSPRSRRTTMRLYFSRFGSARGSIENPMTKEFIDFAKSYIRYTYALRPSKGLRERLLALRIVETALISSQGSADPTRLNVQTLNHAISLAENRFGIRTSYGVGREIENLVGFMRRKKMLMVPVIWKNIVARPANLTRIGPEFNKRRDDKLPPVEALEAIASIFRDASKPSDILISGVCAILCSAPDRISEVLLLPSTCEVSQTEVSTGLMQYGLRWFPSKGGKPQVKWTVSVMADVVKQAIGRIRAITAQARELARWYEQYHGMLYLPRFLEHLRGSEMLTMEEVHQVVFDTDKPCGNLGGVWCRQHGLRSMKIHGRSYISFATLEYYLLSKLPKSFPFAEGATGLRYSEMLFVVQRNLMDGQKSVYRSVFESVDYGNIIRRLSGTTASNIFARFGFVDANGGPLSIGTHQFRHYLNTLAQAGGMSQLDIAIWSGRRNVNQNDAYDHVSANDLLAIAETATSSSASKNITVKTSTFSLISREDWKTLGMTSGHTTEYGYCLHDFSMLPCQLHLDCINCDEQFCVKGDYVREQNIRLLTEETRMLLEAAEVAFGQGDVGSNRWVQHQRLTFERLKQLCQLLGDSTIPDGAIIKLTGITPATKLQQSADKKLIASKDLSK